MISPGKRLCGVASPDWGTAVVQLPWYTYLYFGNEEPLHKYYQEMKYEEMSEIFGTTVGALKASYHHAVKKIEKFLEEID